MAELQTAAEIARSLADVLEEEGLAYAIGGAIALGYHSTPRATIDVDLNIFVDPVEGLSRALAVLARAGFETDGGIQALARQAAEEGQFRGRASGMRIDVFVPAIPYYAELETRACTVSLMGRPLRILGATDLAVLKLMFFRRKDLADVEALLRSPEAKLDRSFVRAKLASLAGEESERVATWDRPGRDGRYGG